MPLNFPTAIESILFCRSESRWWYETGNYWARQTAFLENNQFPLVEVKTSGVAPIRETAYIENNQFHLVEVKTSELPETKIMIKSYIEVDLVIVYFLF